MLGLFMAIICTIGFANSPSLGLVLFFLVLHSPEGFVHPMLSALMSKEVPADAQGELQGGISSIMSLSMLFGTVFFSQIFGYFLKPGAWVTSPDVIYYIASALFVTTLLLFLVIYRPKPDKMTAN